MTRNDPPVIVALDHPNLPLAKQLADQLDAKRCALKIGMELFTAEGPRAIEPFMNAGFRIFLDLKYHDIPNTVAAACVAAANLGVWMINIHTSEVRVLDAVYNALDTFTIKPLIIGVPVLTSIDDNDLHADGYSKSMTTEKLVQIRTLRAYKNGLDGVVCSALEVPALRKNFSKEQFVLVTPGIRMPDGDSNDQKRIASPWEAMHAGSSYLVIGRPITKASDPAAELANIYANINGA